MYKAKKTVEISASHKLDLPYKSKCTSLHGHNYIISVYLKAEKLNEHGTIIDFNHIKTTLLEKLDHKNLNDILPFNPTAENLAKYICDLFHPHCYKVKIKESKFNQAEYNC